MTISLAADQYLFLMADYALVQEMPFGRKPDCDPDLRPILWAALSIVATQVDAGMAASTHLLDKPVDRAATERAKRQARSA